MTLLIVYIVLALGVSFLCSLLEASLLTISASQIELLIEKKKEYGKILKQQKEAISKPLAAILTLNTIAHTIGAAGVGAQIAKLYGDTFMVLASIILTLLILFLSEIIPKTLGASYAHGLGAFTAYTTKILVYLTYPCAILVENISLAISKKTRVRVSREEIHALSKLAAKHGSLSLDESTIIKNLLALKTIAAKQIMTPKSVMFSLSLSAKVGNILEKHKVIPFSRIPIFEDSPENIVGMVLRFNILLAHRDNRDDEPLKNLVQPVVFVHQDTDIASLLKKFFNNKEHLFMVSDGKNSVGIVTLEDAIETLLGVEIVDETDAVVDMRELAARLEKRRGERKKDLQGR